MDKEIKNFIKRRNKALIDLDLSWARKTLFFETKQADIRENIMLAALHKARLIVLDIPETLKKESRKWLLENGYRYDY